MGSQHRRLLTIGIMIVALAGLFVLGFADRGPKFPVAWAPEGIEETMGLGDAKDVTVTFTSDRSLRDVQAWVVPELLPFVKSVVPATFETIEANVPYEVRLSLSVPHDTVPRAYLGTMHLKERFRTHPQTLKIQINVLYAENIPPVANAGPDQTVYAADPATVWLNGEGKGSNLYS